MMKHTLALFSALLLAPLAAISAAASSPRQSRPNLLFLITDQHTIGALSCAGNPYVKTPNLDRLAARGVRFEKSYCTYPLCCPSRGSLFTSRTPHELGIYRNADAELSEKGLQGQTMGELFQAAGYETAYAGKWHIQAPFPGFVDSWGNHKIPGFEVLPITGRNPNKIDPAKESYGLTVDPNAADAAIKFLRRPHSKPFLLVASILNPHDICGYPECAALRSLLPADPAKLPPARPNLRDSQPLPSALKGFVATKGNWNQQQWREYLWVYYRLTEIADGEVGRVLAALEETGLAGNTVVVFTSDHGEMMGSHQMITKQKLYEEAAAVPVIVAPLGGSAGLDQQHLISGLDIMPTLLDYAGIHLPATAEGQSLRPLVEGKTVPWRDFVVSEVNGISESRMVRTARYKYIVYPTGDNREQFFDEQQDPGELKNLIAEPSLAGEAARHRSLLEQWRSATHDKWIGMSIFKGKGRKGKKQNGNDGEKGSPETAATPASDRAATLDKNDKNHDGLAVLVTTAHAADNSPLVHLSFQRSLQPGVRDPNGKLITGTEIDFLVPHQARLYASNCLWMETDSSTPKACQILVLDSPKGQWRVDREFTVNSVMMRCSILKEITFATDGRARAIAPVSLLLAVPDARRGPLKVFCRDDATGDWSASVLGTGHSSIRAMGLHRDKVTRIDRIFAGSNKGVMSGVYDPAAPGRIRWDKSAEVANPVGERGMGFCDCNGILYCATSRHIYQRTDGAAPAWKELYFCEKEISPVGIRGLTAVPTPGGKGEVLWFVALRKVRRLDPAAGFKESIELDTPVFLTEKLGLPVRGVLAAYNDLLPYVMPGTGQRLWLFGFECSHPAWFLDSHPRIKARVQMKDPPVTRFVGNGRYCVRHAERADITYEVAEITDPREPQLVSTRTIAISPFPEDQGQVLYFGGYDCNGVPSHNTAWIYRGEPADTTTRR